MYPAGELRRYDGSVATLQVARDRLAGCSSWPLRFAVYSDGGNLSRRSSCWQWGGTCAFALLYRDVEELLAERGLHPDHVTVWRWVQCYAPEMERRLRSRLKPIKTVGGWTRPTSGLRARGCIYTGLSTPPARRSTSFFLLNATQRPLSASSPKRWAGRTIRRRGSSIPTSTLLIRRPR